MITERWVEATTPDTDEWRAYLRATELGRGQATVNHGSGDWARDDDGDGVREVRCDTMERTWTGLRNFLRPSRGASKRHLAGCLTIFDRPNNPKRIT